MTESVADKRVSWAELFFDLVFVFAVTQVSTLIEDDHTAAGLLRAVIVFVPVYWLWVGTAIQTNLRDSSRPGLRLSIFVVALTATFLALALPSAYAGAGLLFAFSYWIGRLVLGLELLTRAIRTRAVTLNPYTVSMAGTGPLLVVGGLVDGPAREAIWAVAALVDLSSPTVLRSRLTRMHFDAGHLAERFGLFVLIALGESVVAIGSAAESTGPLDVATGSAVAVAFAVSCSLWWVYFHFAADAVRHALATAAVQLDIARLVLSYGHFSFIAAVIVVSVGLREAVTHPTDALGWPGAGLLMGGTALYLATFGFTRWAMFRLVSTTRLSAALVVLVLLPVAAAIPAVATLAGLAVVLAVLNAVELARVADIGWRAKLRRRGSA